MDSFKNHKSFCAFSTKNNKWKYIQEGVAKSQNIFLILGYAFGCKKIPFLLFSKLFVVAKSGISPQIMLRSFSNFRLKLIRHQLTSKKLS